MDISTGSWFKYLREEVLTEGLRDIGLPEKIVDFIENAMANAPEKSKTYAGNQWKKNDLRGFQTNPQRHWATFMEENFENELQITIANGEFKAEARTITPYRVDRNVGPQERKMYDDETIERNKRIAFVFDNVRGAFGKPAGTWRKTFMKAVKALSKAGVESEKVEKVQEWLATMMFREFRSWYSQYSELFDWLNEAPTNYEMIKGEDDINTAYNIAKEDLENREEPENVIHEFPDGSYWYNLNVSSCGIEGERMGHCGSDSRGVLVSLRKRKEKRKASSSYVTMTWEQEGYSGDYLYQIKGRSNEAPPEEVWDHISWFIRNMGITNVQEDGEHSRNPEDFAEMLEYLQRENPSVAFTGVVDEQAIQEALDEVEREYNNDAVHSNIDAQVMGPDEHGGEGHYIYMNAYCSLQINLGWPDIVVRDGGDAYPAVEAGSGDYDDNFHPIPANTYGREARDFSSEIEIDNIEWDLPGEGEAEWSVTMLTGVQPDDEFTPDAPKTAHLEVEIRMTHSEPAADPDEAKWEFEQFAGQIESEFENNYAEIAEKVRRNLVKGEFMAKTAYDRAEDDLVATDLRHWHVYDSNDSNVEFWFRVSPNHASAINNLGGELTSIPQDFQMWAFDSEGTDGEIDGLYTKMFGSPATRTHPPRIENPDLNNEMVMALRKRYREMETDDAQQQLALGDRYKQQTSGPPWAQVLRSNSRFIIIAQSSLQAGAYRKQLVNWKFEIFVDAKSGEQTIGAVKAMIKYFNENPEILEAAAEDVIGMRFANIKALANVNKEEVLSGKRLGPATQRVQSVYGGRAASGSDDWAEKAIATTKWIVDNWDSMGDIEKYVGYYRYVLPLALGGRFNFARDIPNIEMDDTDNYGKPSTWENKVRRQIQLLGGTHGQQSSYGGVERREPVAGAVGEPRPAQESIEQQIERIDQMLNELIEVRRYRMNIEMILDIGPDTPIEDYKDVIRACKGVTTVNTIRSESRGERATAIFGIKFALKAQESRKIYLRETFFPYVKGIVGLSIGPSGYSHPEQLTKLREGSILSTYPLISYGTVPQSSRKFPTPRLSIDKVVDDWTEGGVMAYDTPMDANNMRYHVMVPTEELKKLCGSHYRADANMFTGRYKNFIKNGSQMPVYVAVGQNGRVKITGNEDDVWFASKSGLEELPVFFSYQKQV